MTKKTAFKIIRDGRDLKGLTPKEAKAWLMNADPEESEYWRNRKLTDSLIDCVKHNLRDFGYDGNTGELFYEHGDEDKDYTGEPYPESSDVEPSSGNIVALLDKLSSVLEYHMGITMSDSAVDTVYNLISDIREIAAKKSDEK